MTTYPKNSKQKRERDLRTLVRKLRLLEIAWRRLPKVKLDKPMFMGYKRFFVLKEDILKRKDSEIFKFILEKINTTVYNKSKDFSKYDFDDFPFHFKQTLRTFTEKEFDNLEEKYKKYFTRFKKVDDFRKSEYRYGFKHPQFFVFKIKQHYILEAPILDREMESQIDEIRKKLNRENLWTKIDRLIRGHHKFKDDWDTSIFKVLKVERKRDLKQQLEELD